MNYGELFASSIVAGKTYVESGTMPAYITVIIKNKWGVKRTLVGSYWEDLIWDSISEINAAGLSRLHGLWSSHLLVEGVRGTRETPTTPGGLGLLETARSYEAVLPARDRRGHSALIITLNVWANYVIGLILCLGIRGKDFLGRFKGTDTRDIVFHWNNSIKRWGFGSRHRSGLLRLQYVGISFQYQRVLLLQSKIVGTFLNLWCSLKRRHRNFIFV